MFENGKIMSMEAKKQRSGQGVPCSGKTVRISISRIWWTVPKIQIPSHVAVGGKYAAHVKVIVDGPLKDSVFRGGPSMTQRFAIRITLVDTNVSFNMQHDPMETRSFKGDAMKRREELLKTSYAKYLAYREAPEDPAVCLRQTES